MICPYPYPYPDHKSQQWVFHLGKRVIVNSLRWLLVPIGRLLTPAHAPAFPSSCLRVHLQWSRPFNFNAADRRVPHIASYTLEQTFDPVAMHPRPSQDAVYHIQTSSTSTRSCRKLSFRNRPTKESKGSGNRIQMGGDGAQSALHWLGG